MAPRGDPVQSRVNLFSPQSDWITYHTVVSTSDDQIAIAPGYLQRDWHDKGRHYYEYSMGTTRMADFFAYLSGRYAVRKDVHPTPTGPVNLEVYYDPAHTFNVDQMLATARDGLDYFGKNFAPTAHSLPTLGPNSVRLASATNLFPGPTITSAGLPVNRP